MPTMVFLLLVACSFLYRPFEFNLTFENLSLLLFVQKEFSDRLGLYLQMRCCWP